MDFKVPVQDYRFVMQHLADLDGVLSLPAFSDIETDIVDAVLQEGSRLVEDVIAPLNREGDKNPPVWSDGSVTTPAGFDKAFRLFAEGGWQALQHEAEHGGQGFPKLVGASFNESLHAASMGFALCPMLTDGLIEALSAVGSPEQQQTYLPALLEGRWTGTMNLTEPQAGSDLALLSSRAVKQPDGTYRISGQKIFITYGEHDLAENIVHLVLARTPDAPKGVKGISLFIVPKFIPNEHGEPGVRNDVWCASIEHKLGIHGSPTAVLLFGSGKGDTQDGAVGYLVGQENRGLEYMFIMMNAARYAVGLQGVAVSERALQQAVYYAHDRRQGQAIGQPGGPVAIVHHPDVQRMLLTMSSLTEGARAVALYAAMAHDKANHHPDDTERARYKALYDYLVPIVKGFSTEMSLEVTSLGVQIHGGMGFIEETGAAQHYRDARILPIYEGTTAIQANDFVGRKVVRDAGQVAESLAADMLDTARKLQHSSGTPHAPALQAIGKALERAVDAYRQVVEFILNTTAEQPRVAYLGSVPFLMLAGYVHSGWLMAKAAAVAVQCIEQGETDTFYTRKLANSVFYATTILPRVHGLSASIVQGALAETYARQWVDAGASVA